VLWSCSVIEHLKLKLLEEDFSLLFIFIFISSSNS